MAKQDSEKNITPAKSGMQLLAEKMSKAAIDKGTTYDPKLIDEIGAGREGTYSGLEKNYPAVNKDFFDPYEDYIDRGTLRGGQYDIETLNRLRADNQSNWEQLGHGLGRVAYNIVPQIVSGFASMIDIPGYWDAEHAASNGIVEWADSWKKEVDQNIFPIYEENPNDAMQLGDFAWWASRGSGLVESVASFLVQGGGAAKLSSLGLKGLSRLGGKQLSRTILGAKNSKMLLQAGNTLGTAVMLNQSEAVIESAQVFRDTYDERLKLGYSAEDANKAAAAAASTTMNLNRINILLNLTSAGAFLKPFRGTRALLSAPTFAKSATEILKEGGQEAVEELINHVAAKKGMATGRGKNYGFNEALADIVTTEGFEAAFLGALGGMAQTGGTNILKRSKYGPASSTDSEGNRISSVQDDRDRYTSQQEVINSLKEKGVTITDTLKDLKDTILFQEKLNKAIEENDQATYNSLKEEMFENQALKAFKSGTTGILEDLYKQETKKNIEEVGQEHIDAAQIALKNIKDLEKVYNNFEDYSNIDEVFYNRANKIRLGKNISLLEKERNNAGNELSKQAATIAKKYSFKESQDVLIKEEGELKETYKRDYSTPIPLSLENLEENIGSTEENKETYNKFLKEVKALPSYEQYKSYTDQIEKMENASVSLEKQFGKITSKKYQEEFLKEQAKQEELKSISNRIDSMSSIAELEKIKETISDEALRTKIDGRIIQLKEDQNKELNQKKKEVIYQQIAKNIDEASLEHIESLRDNIYKAEISQEQKDNLLDQVNRKIEVLNGNAVEDPLAKFTSESPEELAAKVKEQEKIYSTNIPTDIPNNNTEKKDVEKELSEAIKKLKEEKPLNINQSDNIYDYNRTKEGNNRAAYLSRQFNQKSDLGIFSREDISDLLDNIQVLDPDTLISGTSIILEIKSDYEGEKYNPDSNTKEKIQWKVRELELEQKYGEGYRTSNEYISEVPIVAKSTIGEELFYVHDLSWIKEENVESDDITKDRNKLFAIRSKIVNQGRVKTTILYKGFGKLFKTSDNKSIPIAEAMPDKNLVLAIGQDGNFKMWGSPSKLLKGRENAKILNPDPDDGRLYAIVPVGPIENIAIPLERQLLNEESVNSIIKVIELYLNNDSENTLVKEIGSPSSLNINILELSDLSKYISRFVYLVNTEGQSGLAPLLDVGTEELNSAIPLIAVTATGIEFGRPGINDQLAGKGKKVITISRNFQETDNEERNEKAKQENLNKLAKLKTHLSKMLVNADKNTLQSKGKTAIITSENTLKTIPYTNYIKQNFTTNIQSANIGIEEQPNWIYTIQPTILFDTDFINETVLQKETSKIDIDDSLDITEEDSNALELANADEITLSQLKGMLSNIELGVSVPGVTKDILKKAIQIRESKNNNKEEGKIKVGDLEIDLEDGDISDDDIDNFIPILTQEQLDLQKQEIDSLIISGIDPRTQQSLISYLASKVIQKSLEQKELTGDSTINTKQIFQENKTNFSNLSKLCKEKGLTNKADKLDNIVNQFDKVQSLTQQYLSLLSTGTISDINTDENEEGGGLERANYSDDWAFTVSSKNTASADLKKFFSFIEARNQNGIIKNPLGFPEIIPFDEVYDTLHELLANKPSDYNTMMEYLELYQNKFPWIKSVIERLESSPEKIQNEFVSDMAKHSIDMRFIMWSKDKNGYFSLQDWSSNASSTEQRIRSVWNSNLKGLIIKTPLVSVDSESNYVFNQDVADKLINQAKTWNQNPPVIKTELKEKSFQEVSNWLNHFGIELSNETIQDLADGKFINKERLDWNSLFKNNNGLIKVLAKELEKKKDLFVDESELLNDTVVKQLARLEASNNLNIFSNSFQAGGKTIYSYGNNNYLVNRMRDLTAVDENGNFINQKMIDDLKAISFTQDSILLKELTSNDEIGRVTRNTLSLNYLSLEALKKKFTPSQDNRKLNKLTTAEHEVAKIAFFFNNSGNNIDGEKRRVVRFFYPTMSDKSTMLTIQSLSRELKLNEEGNISKENLELLYDAVVLPEIKRIQAKQADNVSGYEPNYFYFIPSLNTLPIQVGNKTREFRDLILDKITINDDIKDQVINELRKTIEDLINKKLKDWFELGIGLNNAREKIHYSFLDKGYISKIAKGGNEDAKLRYSATDYVYNYMIANAESYKLFTGDPAMYAKFKKGKSLEENLAESFINMGKRLAGDIAPGIELANSKDNNYYQVFFNDKKIDSDNITDSIQLEYFSKIMEDFKDNYSDIEGSDAQEYTTWKEHLYVMKQLGRLTSSQYKTFHAKLSSNKSLTYDELGIILQPIKPVYVGNQLDVKNNIDKRIYIKSSSFPLIPQLTSGLEINKIRKALEKFQDSKSKETYGGTSPTIRASFATANKVGAIKNSLNIFDDNGDVIDNLEVNDSHTLLLNRENFRIQQDVPYKREKEEINIGTQERKLLFVNLLDVQVTETQTGEQLLNTYNNNYKQIFEYSRDKFLKLLGLNNEEDIVPAEKLAEILRREVSTRTGYPLNMLSALELNEDKTDFIIPLWASPYASKFESLLTSLVNNKVVKQKFPGHSYVLGSQEGFKIKEGEDIDLSDSGIVFSKNFDPVKGLKPMRYDPTTKTILPAQIMIPFKFKDELGDILNLNDFTKEEDGRTVIDFEKIPEEILTLFGFRIPTQERNSMAAIEIVGFLPEASGDLILAPRDFTKQMGSDFDVDKLYSYMYNTYFKDGKLNNKFEYNKITIEENIKVLEEELQNLKKELKITEQEEDIINRHIAREEVDEETGLSTILDSLGRRNTKEIISKLKETILDLSILERSYKAARQNKILDIHLEVMTSTNPEVISSIMALDSFGEFEPLSKEINKVRIEAELIPPIITILSETYQRTKYINATAGKDGVGTFSLDSTFNASAQGKELVYLNLDKEGLNYLKKNPNITNEKLLAVNEDIVSFGDITSKGDMSNKYTLRSQQIIKKAKGRKLTKEEQSSLKMKSTIIRALQSSAVDNEKAQILDKLNINNETFDTIRALTILGFEEEDIVGLLTQEIVWEYIDQLKNAQSSLSGFVENVSEKIKENLRVKYDPNDRLATLEESEIQLLSSSSGKQLIDNIKNRKLIESPDDTPDFNLEQLLLLDKFLSLKEIGQTIKQVQSAINTESKGIPKSLLEVKSKIQQLATLPKSIYNINNLIGKYDGLRIEEPTTINGYASYYGTYLAGNIFNRYFPYNRKGFGAITDEVIEYISGGKELSPTKQNTLRQEIFSDMKSYLFANTETGLFTENANLERNRIFIDTPTNKSLANILTSLFNESWYQQNGFLNKLTFDLNQNGTPSRIYFESSTGENFDERNIYLGFLYLLDKNFSIGTFNGIEYTTRMLAQELVTASFLEGGEQGAKQYLKYIPISYLKSVNFGNYLGSLSFDHETLFGSMEENKSYIYPSTFARQYFQNNPSTTKTISIDDIEGSPKNIPNEFVLNKKALENNLVEIVDSGSGETFTTQIQFLSIYDNKAIGKYSLYEFDTVSRSYKRIPVTSGAYGFSQYNSEFPLVSVLEKNDISRLVEQVHPNYITPESIGGNINNSHKLEKGKDLNVKYHLGNKQGLDDILNQLELSDSVTNYNRKLIEEFRKMKLPEGFEFFIFDKKNLPQGSYNSTHNQLMINMYYLNNLSANEVATTILHELAHTYTSRAIKYYEKGLTNLLTKEQIEIISSIKNLKKQYINYLVKLEGGEKLTAYHRSNYIERYNKGQISKGRLMYLLDRGILDLEGKYDFNIEDKTLSHSKYYGAMETEEFVTMALTDQGFQNHLNEVVDEDSKSFWSKLVDSLINLLDALGIKVKKDSLLRPALEESLKLMKTSIPQQATEDNGAEDFTLNVEEYQKYLLICGK